MPPTSRAKWTADVTTGLELSSLLKLNLILRTVQYKLRRISVIMEFKLANFYCVEEHRDRIFAILAQKGTKSEWTPVT